MASMRTTEAASLDLPPATEAVAHIRTSGLITRPDFKAELQWRRITGQSIVGAERVGSWLRIGTDWKRLPDALFDIAEAVDRLNRVPADRHEERYSAIAELQEVLPPAKQAGDAVVTGLINEMTIAIADAFSLNLVGDKTVSRPPMLVLTDGEPRYVSNALSSTR